MYKPTVLVGPPDSPADHKKLVVDGVTVYISGAIKPKPGSLTPQISLHGFWIFKDLEIQGVRC